MPMRRVLRVFPLFALTVLVLAAIPTTLHAQAEAVTGIIRGTVTDPTGLAVPGAEVTIRNRNTGLQRSVTTNESGGFVITLLPVGDYDVTVSAIGQFGSIRLEALPVRLGQIRTLDLAFQPVEVETITVSGEALRRLIDPTDVTSSHRLEKEQIQEIPNNGRNYVRFTLLTPGVSVVQGPDGRELTISGQRGIFNNVMVDGADFNNPFFGEERGGQRPAFTFNQNAIEEIVVVSQGAPAEFGRSAGGFVNIITKSGTNEFAGEAHYFGQSDGLQADFPESRGGGSSDFSKNQFGFTLGGPIVKDKAFFFISYDQQEASETKQETRIIAQPAEFAKLQDFLANNFGGVLANDFGPIERTDDAISVIAKLDFNLGDANRLSLKYNYTRAEQINGTFDVDTWGFSANGIEKDFSHAVNGQLSSQLSSTVSNEFRFQWAREDRPRPYEGPINPDTGLPFPDTGADFADSFRWGLPFFLPIEPAFDRRIQINDNLTFLAGDHLFKVGVEWNRTEVGQTFIGFENSRIIFASVDGFINYVENGDKSQILFYQRNAPVPPLTSLEQSGTQQYSQNELAFFIQDTWNPNEHVTLSYGLRWEGLFNPDMIVPADEVFYGPFIGQTKFGVNGEGPFEFPSDGTIPNDLNNWQPRFGMTYDVNADGRTVLRVNGGSYFARIPGLVLAQWRTTNGSLAQSIFAAPDTYGELPETDALKPFFPGVQIPDKELELPRTWSFSFEFQQALTDNLAARVNYQHARTDNLFRFVDRNDPVFGSPWGSGLSSTPAGQDTLNGILPAANFGMLTAESSARSVYNGLTLGFAGNWPWLNFDANYTLSYDKTDDDNERDPFVVRYARPDRLDAEYNWSDRDRRNKFNSYFLFILPANIRFNHVFQAASAQPVSESCGASDFSPFAPPAGARAAAPADRNCADGSVITRNTLRKDNDFFRWDLRVAWPISAGRVTIEPILDIFNVTNADNFLDTAPSSLLFNFDGTIRSGLGDPRRAQLGVRIAW
jgi:hypothetical protein